MKQQWFNIGRIGAISDGVFAISMTLLVLELKLPELKDPVSREMFNQAILDQTKKSGDFTTINFIFLGAISFIPFPTSLISEHSEQPLSVIIFSATLIVAGLALVRMWRLLEKKGLEPDTLRDMNRRVRRVVILMLAIAIISCLLATVNAHLGILVWIVFPFAGIIIRRKKAHNFDQV
jgi:uncharacterized membrane protein